MPEPEAWLDYDRFTTTVLGWTLASADKAWTLITANSPADEEDGQDYLWLVRHEGEWLCSFDPDEGCTPVWSTSHGAKKWLTSAEDLPGGREQWHPITIGDVWRRSEGRPLRFTTSQNTIAAIQAASNKETA